jgi:hypothetical protein
MMETHPLYSPFSKCREGGQWDEFKNSRKDNDFERD